MPATKNDAPEYNGMRTYYLITFIIFGLLSLNCFGFASTWAGETCLVKDDLQALVDKELAKSAGGGEAAPAADPAADEAEAGADAEVEAEAGEETAADEAAQTEVVAEEEVVLEDSGRLRFLTTDRYKTVFQRLNLRLTKQFKKHFKKFQRRGRKLMSFAESNKVTELGQQQDPKLVLKPGSSSVGNVFIMACGYATQAGLSFIIWSGMTFFSKYLPTEVPKLNICFRLFGGIIRMCMKLQIYLHYVTFFQVIMLWIASLSDACQFNVNLAVLAEGAPLSLDDRESQAGNSLLQMNGMFWFLMHVIGGMIRSMVYLDPYYDNPVDPDVSEVQILLFEKCGP